MIKKTYYTGEFGDYKLEFQIDENNPYKNSPVVCLYKKRKVLFWSQWVLIFLSRIREHLFDGGYDFSKYTNEELNTFTKNFIRRHERIIRKNKIVEARRTRAKAKNQ